MRRTQGYKPYLDKVIENIGRVTINQRSWIDVDIRRYGDLDPRIGVIHTLIVDGEERKEGRTPRLTAQAALDLSELLATAAERLGGGTDSTYYPDSAANDPLTNNE